MHDMVLSCTGPCSILGACKCTRKPSILVLPLYMEYHLVSWGIFHRVEIFVDRCSSVACSLIIITLPLPLCVWCLLHRFTFHEFVRDALYSFIWCVSQIFSLTRNRTRKQTRVYYIQAVATHSLAVATFQYEVCNYATAYIILWTRLYIIIFL